LTARIVEDLVLLGLDDWVHLADVALATRAHTASTRTEDVIEAGSAAVEAAVRAGLMEVGDVTDTGFHAWAVDATEARRRLRSGWQALDRDPVPGDVCWLANTERGDGRAHELRDARQT
jgi:hypothetical protein